MGGGVMQFESEYNVRENFVVTHAKERSQERVPTWFPHTRFFVNSEEKAFSSTIEPGKSEEEMELSRLKEQKLQEFILLQLQRRPIWPDPAWLFKNEPVSGTSAT